jgi:hypothetical protein
MRKDTAITSNLEIDDNLIEQARQIGHHATREAAITIALEEYIQHRKQLEILDLFGTVDFDPGYDFKAKRQLDRIEIET